MKRPENLQNRCTFPLIQKEGSFEWSNQALTGFGFCVANVDHKCGSLVELVGGCVG